MSLKRSTETHPLPEFYEECVRIQNSPEKFSDLYPFYEVLRKEVCDNCYCIELSLARRTHLNLNFAPRQSNTGPVRITPIAQYLSHLESIAFHSLEASELDDSFWGTLAALKKLERVSINGSALEDLAPLAALVKSNSKITTLDLISNQIRAINIDQFPDVRSLDLSGNKNLTLTTTKAPSLRQLILSNTGIRQLPLNMPSLETLLIDNNETLRYDRFQPHHYPSLLILDITRTGLTQSSWVTAWINHHPEAERLEFKENPLRFTSTQLGSRLLLHAIKHLEFRYSPEQLPTIERDSLLEINPELVNQITQTEEYALDSPICKVSEQNLCQIHHGFRWSHWREPNRFEHIGKTEYYFALDPMSSRSYTEPHSPHLAYITFRPETFVHVRYQDWSTTYSNALKTSPSLLQKVPPEDSIFSSAGFFNDEHLWYHAPGSTFASFSHNSLEVEFYAWRHLRWTKLGSNLLCGLWKERPHTILHPQYASSPPPLNDTPLPGLVAQPIPLPDWVTHSMRTAENWSTPNRLVHWTRWAEYSSGNPMLVQWVRQQPDLQVLKKLLGNPNFINKYCSKL